MHTSTQYLTAAELTPLGQHRSAVIHDVTQELVGQNREPKLVLTLVSAGGRQWPKDVVLNKTNALHLQAAYGDDTDGWSGQQIEIWRVGPRRPRDSMPPAANCRTR